MFLQKAYKHKNICHDWDWLTGAGMKRNDIVKIWPKDMKQTDKTTNKNVCLMSHYKMMEYNVSVKCFSVAVFSRIEKNSMDLSLSSWNF